MLTISLPPATMGPSSFGIFARQCPYIQCVPFRKSKRDCHWRTETMEWYTLEEPIVWLNNFILVVKRCNITISFLLAFCRLSKAQSLFLLPLFLLICFLCFRTCWHIVTEPPRCLHPAECHDSAQVRLLLQAEICISCQLSDP